MVTDQQVRRLFKLVQTNDFGTASAKAGMDEKTARKYVDLGKIPSDIKKEHDWRTREDPFLEVWSDIQLKLETNPNLEAKTLFEWRFRRNRPRVPIQIGHLFRSKSATDSD